MNARDNHEPTSVDELQDRLLSRGLAEVVGGETPPDLSSLILTGKRPGMQQAAAVATSPRRAGRGFWITLAVAAMLFIALVPLLWPTINATRESGPIVDRGVDLRQRTHVLVDDTNSTSVPSLSTVAPETWTGERQPSHGFLDGSGQRDVLFLQQNQAAAQPVIVNGIAPADRPMVYPDAEEWRELSERGRQANGGEVKASEEGRVGDRKPLVAAYGGPAGNKASRRDGVGEYFDTRPLYGDEFSHGAKFGIQNRPWDTDGDGVLGGDGLQDVDEISEFGRLREGLGMRPDKTTELGSGPGLSGDQYVRIYENPFVKAEGGAAVSTFSIDVDTASYANVRRFLLQENTLPPADAVRIEELVNYFKYDYAPPAGIAKTHAGDKADKKGEAKPAPFAAHLEVAGCPWAPEHRLVRIGVKGLEMDRRERPKSNLVFLVDVSGSMDEPSKLPLVVDGLKELARELGGNDRVAIVVYAQQEGLVLPSTLGTNQAAILGSLNQLRAGGSTAGGAGIQLAYQIAEDNFIRGGTNRIILCTDGDFNVGVTSTGELQRMAGQKAKDTGVFLSVLGFGRGNLNDQMMEAIADHGNGNYHYVDDLREARRVFVEEMSGTLVTIAKDVKIQVEFNPRQVAGYRLLGYENRMLRTEDFNDDKKDAGEIGAGHTVTALYEIVPAGKPVDLPPVEALKYQQPAVVATDAGFDAKAADISRELLTLKMKYKQPEADKSEDALEWALTDEGKAFSAASADFQFAASVAGFGMLLRNSQYKGNLTYAAAIELSQGSVGSDEQGYRRELVDMIRRAKQLRGE
jgi:Ca-activated chloride channel family protein